MESVPSNSTRYPRESCRVPFLEYAHIDIPYLIVTSESIQIKGYSGILFLI